MTPKLNPEQLVRLVKANSILLAFSVNSDPSIKQRETAKEAAEMLDVVVGELLDVACK